MKYVAFGNTGIQVSQMCLGTMMFGERTDEAESDRILGSAMDGGVNFIDTAAAYAGGHNEEILGRILKGRRAKLFITTKVNKGVDKQSIESSITESLARMQTDWVDLYMIHWPLPGMHPAEMMEALNNVVVKGQARLIGFCNCPAWLFAHMNAIAQQNGWAKLVCNQVPYNVLERGIEVEILPQAVAEGIAITIYRALVIGLLTGKYEKGKPLPKNVRGEVDARIPAWLNKFGDGLAQFKAFAAQRGLEMTQLAIAWVNHAPGATSPIVGISSARQLASSLKAFELELTAKDYQMITSFFDTQVQEEAGGKFPGLRREVGLVTNGAGLR